MAEGPTVDILMATYQAESWADVQIATIIVQDYSDWRLVIRDDGSTDRTPEIIRAWRDRFPEKICILDEHDPRNLGVTGNFTALLQASSAPYVMLSSWDDVWYRDKVSRAVRSIQCLEANSVDTPLLVHTDLRVVDMNLHELAPSARKKFLGRTAQKRPTISSLCLENPAWGCAVIINRALVRLGIPIPKRARCEDHWLALVAAVFGKIIAQSEVSLDWRRHGLNDSKSLSLLASVLSAIKDPGAHRRALLAKLEVNRGAIQAFSEAFRDLVPKKERDAMEAFLCLPAMGFFARRHAILKQRIFYSSWIRTLGLLILV